MEIFPYIVYKEKLDNHFEIKDNIQYFLDSVFLNLESDKLNRYKSIHGESPGLNSRFDKHYNDLHKFTELSIVREVIKKHLQKYLEKLSIFDYDCEIEKAFISNYDNGIGIHLHSDVVMDTCDEPITYNGEENLLTVVYYVEADKGCGDLVLHNPFLFDYTSEKIINNKLIGTIEDGVNMDISEGDLVIHPSYMPHEVTEAENPESNRVVIIHFVKVIRR